MTEQKETSEGKSNQSETIFPKLSLVPSEWREAMAQDSTDLAAYNAIQQLRSETETMEQWRILKQAAEAEVATLPTNIIGQLLEKAAPFLEALPTAHSKGHVARDLVNLTAILHDPEVATYGDVEILVGIFGGIFHDIGNAVVDRYDENKRFAGHAEVGAILFGETAQDILPENLRKLTQLAIAAHVNVPVNVEVTKATGESRMRTPYANTIEATDKQGMYLARLSDRLEIQSIIQVVRLILANARPIEDSTGADEIDKVQDNAATQFRHKFNPKYRIEQGRIQFEKGSILAQFTNYIASATGGRNEHTKYDPEQLEEEVLLRSAVKMQTFINAIVDESGNHNISPGESLESLFKLSQLLEPGSDIDEVINLLREKFQDPTYLSAEDQQHWIYAINMLTNPDTGLYQRWYKRMQERIHEKPPLQNVVLQETTVHIIEDLHQRANAVLRAIDPSHISRKESIMVAMLS